MTKSFKMVNAEDLVIVKLSSFTKPDIDEAGDIEGIETVESAPYYVLAKKGNLNGLVLVKEPKVDQNGFAYESLDELHQLAENKTEYKDRFVKPVNLCKNLQNHKFTPEQLKVFAENIESVSAEQPDEYAKAQLEKICELAFEHFFADELSL